MFRHVLSETDRRSINTLSLAATLLLAAYPAAQAQDLSVREALRRAETRYLISQLQPRYPIEEFTYNLMTVFKRDPIGVYCRQIEAEMKARTYPVVQNAPVKFLATLEYFDSGDNTYPLFIDQYTTPSQYSLLPVQPWKGNRRVFKENTSLVSFPNYLYTLDYQETKVLEPDQLGQMTLCFTITVKR